MKLYNRTSISIMAFLGLLACSEPELPTAVPSVSSATPYKANFLFVNAAANAPGLDLLINGNKVGTSLEANSNQAAYSEVSLTSEGRTGSLTANTSIRAKAVTGTIGGTLGSADVIFRAGSNNTNNFQAVEGSRYTIFAIDTIARPRPVRTINASNFADITYYSSRPTFTAPSKLNPTVDTTIQISVGSNNSMVLANLLRKYNSNQLPSFFIPIGLVPLGSSDPGGSRFYLAQDVIPTISANNQVGIRFVHASPNAPAVFVRLKSTSTSATSLVAPTSGTTGISYVMSTTGGFNPSVGSRTVTSTSSTFPLITIDPALTYNVEVSTNVTFTNIVLTVPVTLVIGKSYTIYAKGLLGGTGNLSLGAGIIQHN